MRRSRYAAPRAASVLLLSSPHPWLGLAAIVLYSGAAAHLLEQIWQRTDHAVASPGLVMSIYTIGAIPIGLALLIAWAVLLVIRAALRLSR